MFQKALYVFSCDMPVFFLWGIYSLAMHSQFSWIVGFSFVVSLFLSLDQWELMSSRLEHIHVKADEMTINGVDITNLFMTAVTYLFVFSVFIPEELKGAEADRIIILISLSIQFVFALLTDQVPYNLIYVLRGYAYRSIKIGGSEQVLLCKKRIRNIDSIKVVINPFRGFVIHVDPRKEGDL